MKNELTIRNKNYLRWFQLFGIVLFAVILTKLDFNSIKNQLVQFKWEWLIVYAVSFVLMLFFKVLRWRSALSKQNINYSVKKVFIISAITSFWGLVTPGKLGELTKITFLQKDNYPSSKSLVSIVLDRLYDVFVLSLLGMFSLIYFTPLLNTGTSIIIAFLGFVTVVVVSIYFFKNGIWELLKKVIKLLLPEGKYNLFTKEWNVFKSDFLKIFPSTIIPMLTYSILAYICYYLQIYVVAVGFGVEISFVYLGLCSSFAAIISLIPISLGGLGTREAVFIYLLSKISIPSETAVLISFIEGSVFAIVLMALIALISYLWFKIKFK
jgi:uncharacterized protein (TIRG00374 family)